MQLLVKYLWYLNPKASFSVAPPNFPKNLHVTPPPALRL